MNQKKETPESIYLQIVTTGNLENWSEYGIEDASGAYPELEEGEVTQLLKYCQDPDVFLVTRTCAKKVHGSVEDHFKTLRTKASQKAVHEFFTESDHAGWEGYNQEDLPTIYKLIADLAMALENM
jgi:hypothetical protein